MGGQAGSGDGDPFGGAGECGGCQAYQSRIQCASGVVQLSAGEQQAIDEGGELCAVVQRRFDSQGGGGAGGQAGSNGAAGAGAAGAAEAGLCATYVAPGHVVGELLDGECFAAENEFKQGECVLGGECCVVIEFSSCGY